MKGLVKLDKFARLPVKNIEFENGFTFHNAYTAVIHKNDAASVSSGMVLPKLPSHVALILGVSPSPQSKNLEIKSNFIGMGSELKTSILNYGDDVAELPPFKHLTDFVVLKVAQDEPVVVEDLGDTERGASGFGSTGLK
jgi:dUTPase